MKTLYEAYLDVHYNGNNFYDDVVNFCEENNIFDTLDESEYFAKLVIENDLGITFVEDVLEYCHQEQLLDEEYISEVSAGVIKAGLKAAGGIFKDVKLTPAVKGLSAKTLAKKGYTPGGFGKGGKPLNASARKLQARSARAARAERAPSSPQKPNKYLDMLAQKRASQTPKPTSTAPKPNPKGMTPSYVAKRGVTDTLATTLALGMGHMAGLKPVTNVLRQMTTPVTRSVANVAQRSAPTVRKASGAATDPWMQFPKVNKAKQYGLPKEGPSSQLPGRFLPKPNEPKGLLPPAKGTQVQTTTRRRPTGAATDPWMQFPKTKKPRQYGLPKEGPSSQLPGRFLPKANEPKGLLPPAKEVVAKRRPTGAATDPWMQFPKTKKPRQYGLPKEGPSSQLPNKILPKPTSIKGLLAPAKGTPGGTGSGYKHVSIRGTQPFRATGPSGGDPRLERLAAQAAKPQTGGRLPRKPNIGAAAAAAAGAGALVGADALNKKNQKYDVYNTMDPSGKVRSRLKVGRKIVGGLGPATDFEDAFRKNRAAGKKTFKYGKDEYTTELAKEEFYSELVSVVLNEGYATDVKSAQEIVNSMSDEWVASILLGD